MAIHEAVPVIEKYRGIAAGGWKVARDSHYKEFTVFPESLKNRFNVSALFDPESVARLKEQVTDFLLQLGLKHEVEYFLAGREFPPHTTIMEANLPAYLLPARDAKFSALGESLPDSPLVAALVGQKIVYNDLLVDGGGNVLLVARTIPSSVLAARSTLLQEYTQVGLQPLAMDNILHASIARPVKLPSSHTDHYRLRGLRTEIRTNPVGLKVGRLHVGSAWDLLNSR